MNNRECPDCQFFPDRPGDEHATHHPSCVHAPPTDRNRFVTMMGPKKRADPQLDEVETMLDKKVASRQSRNRSRGFCVMS